MKLLASALAGFGAFMILVGIFGMEGVAVSTKPTLILCGTVLLLAGAGLLVYTSKR